VRLLGDDRQLGAVESGGALRLIAAQPGTPELSVLYRFRDPAEACATLQIRAGDGAAVGWYHANGRIRSGSRDAMTQAAYRGWKADMLAGKTSLMAAGTGTDVVALAAQARADRVAAGHVESGGVTLADGNLAGRGDWIVTRANRRTLAVNRGRDWVKNGDAWQVVRRHPDGSLACRHLGHGGHVRLPAGYVADSVELLYATTAHRAEGTTVDTAHPLVTTGMTREMLYVLASRAREKTTLYVATHDVLPADEDERVDRTKNDPRSYAAREILHNILAAEGSELSATAAIRKLQDEAGSLASLVPRYLHAAHQLADRQYRDAAVLVFGERDGRELAADPAWGALVRRLYDAETAGWQPARLLAAVARQRELGTADSIAEVLCWRIDGYLPDRNPPAWLDQPTAADARRYAALLGACPAAAGLTLDPEQALTAPSVLTVRRPDDAHDEQRQRERERDDSHADQLTAVLGPALSRRAQTEPAWPALAAALRRTSIAGHDPATVLTTVARSRELRTARNISHTLAWRIGRYLTTNPSPLGGADTGNGSVPRRETWRLLTWALKATEDNGIPAEQILATTRRARDLRDVIAVVSQAALRRPAEPAAAPLPPWLRSPPAHAGDGVVRYLDDAATLISSRVHALAADAERDRPAWMSLLRTVPPTGRRHEQWLRHIGVIAAYRDQQQVTTDDPRQVLGPYPEPGKAGHTAYWHAVDAVLAARRIAHLDPAPGPRQPDQISAQIAADIYRALPERERRDIATTMAAELGPAWLGHLTEPDQHAVTQPAYAAHLAQLLTARGHLSPAAMPHAEQDDCGGPLEARIARRRGERARPPVNVGDLPMLHQPGTLQQSGKASAGPRPPADRVLGGVLPGYLLAHGGCPADRRQI